MYNRALSPTDPQICDLLSREIDIVGYSKLKSAVRLLFWSGQSFASSGLMPERKFKAAEARICAAEVVAINE